jgi:hypothetical protein
LKEDNDDHENGETKVIWGRVGVAERTPVDEEDDDAYLEHRVKASKYISYKLLLVVLFLSG